MKVKIINRSANELPAYATEGAAGLDLRANLEQSITLKPLQRMAVPTGIHIELPLGYEAQIRPRSGLALKLGLGLVNSPGTIDSDYTGEIRVILVNLSDQEVQINHGERIAQMVVARYEKIEWEEVNQLTESERGTGGFGSTGMQ